MKKVLKLKNIVVLKKEEQQKITAGVAKDWFKCCLKEDSPELPPFGCEAWVICDGNF